MTAHQDLPSLAMMVETAIAVSEHGNAYAEAFDIARTSCRIPRAVLNEVRATAHANEMSVSLVINLLLDSYLSGQGRSGYAVLAPWYPDYALRTPEATIAQIPLDNTGE